jgi:hypothetical protein
MAPCDVDLSRHLCLQATCTSCGFRNCREGRHDATRAFATVKDFRKWKGQEHLPVYIPYLKTLPARIALFCERLDPHFGRCPKRFEVGDIKIREYETDLVPVDAFTVMQIEKEARNGSLLCRGGPGHRG